MANIVRTSTLLLVRRERHDYILHFQSQRLFDVSLILRVIRYKMKLEINSTRQTNDRGNV